ncbi:hydroxyethylthiazole kinase [Marivibrio halodurans]|uniref:Hydroxyethylthiazole kinase n=1 Tax=Marivibrio halodurans TaxID=2039722 RepID=A0A8J7SA82_9PROT|nr:hydroxyethylthiazole kinase [Marivibrio halodurans]MBP5858322.1 hydroxyethylthiazole kinase [Marivibrio halodurans]
MADRPIDVKGRLDAGADALDRLRATAPRVHCLTNMAAANLVANGLLALGAVPSLTDHDEEVGAFTAGAGALSVNLGTPDAERLRAIDIAVAAAKVQGVPWVLDPVMIDRAPTRLRAAAKLVNDGPAVLRLNEGERAALFDSADAPSFDGVLAISGAADSIGHHGAVLRVANGDPMMTRVTGMGCLLGALTGAFLTVERDGLTAALAASVLLGLAGERAAGSARGPGGFQPALLDRLHDLTPDDLMRDAKVTTCAD